ncbi:hypothetical protein [Nostoc sp. 'Peltigera membranacea cyanobiont' 213]|uniref:hypothetical protein n=1 Tax=Nostoc sp. 'Peltigera membranacea cyanobiont' 213 TaxID=2014530 RepID=UPI00167C932D|nr:hypothetical protein [Nostoc sp. 'Peltigera membranacea cyanobiont' 213]
MLDAIGLNHHPLIAKSINVGDRIFSLHQVCDRTPLKQSNKKCDRISGFISSAIAFVSLHNLKAITSLSCANALSPNFTYFFSLKKVNLDFSLV